MALLFFSTRMWTDGCRLRQKQMNILSCWSMDEGGERRKREWGKEGREGGLVGRNRSAVWIHTRHVNRISYIILKDIIWTSMNLSAELIFFQSISPDGYARYWIGSDLDVQTSIPQIPSSKVKGWDALLLAVSSSLQHLLFTSDWTISYIIYEP